MIYLPSHESTREPFLRLPRPQSMCTPLNDFHDCQCESTLRSSFLHFDPGMISISVRLRCFDKSSYRVDCKKGSVTPSPEITPSPCGIWSVEVGRQAGVMYSLIKNGRCRISTAMSNFLFILCDGM